MAKIPLTNVKMIFGQYDISSDLNQISLSISRPEVDQSTFGDDWENYMAGPLKGGWSMQGLWSAGTGEPDDILWTSLTATNDVVSWAADGMDDGERAVLAKTVSSTLERGGSYGDALGFSGGGGINDWMLEGTVMHDLGTARTSSSNGTARQLGALSANQTLYSALHVTAASGSSPTLDVVIQSDDNGGMSSPASRITHTQATGATSEALSVAGAVTDDYWRVNYTIGGGSPSFTFVNVLGIGPS